MERLNLPKLSTILAIASLVYIMTASAGLIYSVLYYKEFSIDISNYITLEESLLLFMPKIKGIGAFLLMFGIVAVVSHLILSEYFERYPLKSCLAVLGVILLYLLAGPILSLIIADDFEKYRTIFFLRSALVACIISAGLYFLSQWKFKMTRQTRVILCIVFMYAYGTYSLCYLNVKVIKTFRKVSSACIFYNDNTPPIFASQAKKYIGRSKNYIFLYDSSSREATILSAENVKRIVLRK